MQLSDQETFMEILTNVAEMYNKTLSPMQLEVYWTALAGFELEDLRRAFALHTVNPDGGQFMPKPADVCKYLVGGGQSQAQLAWSKVAKAIARIGHYKTVVFDDALIHRVIDDMDGWCRLCMVTEKELPFKAREFEQRYASYLFKPPLDYPKQLSGYTEQHNSAHSFPEHIKAPLAVGDKQKAQAVLESGSEPTTFYHVLEAFEIPRMCPALPAPDEPEVQVIEASTAKPECAEPQIECASNFELASPEMKKAANGGG